MKSARQCRVCDAANACFLCSTHNEHSEQTELEHYRCAECGSVFVGNDIGPEELGRAYSTLNTKAYYEEIASENRKKMSNAIEHLGELIPRSASVLDVGTGNGQFVERLHEAGFTDLSAHEIPGADLSGIERITRDLYQDFDYGSIPSDRFDAVTLLDVVEHVPKPQYLMNACHRVLKPGGVLYFHTPVVTRADRMMHRAQKLPVLGKIGRAWQRGRTSVFHLENYTPQALSLILTRAGFGDVTVRVRNELSWPVSRYVRVYLLQKQRLPGFLAPILTPALYPVLATDFFNGNKSIVSAKKTPG